MGVMGCVWRDKLVYGVCTIAVPYEHLYAYMGEVCVCLYVYVSCVSICSLVLSFIL